MIAHVLHSKFYCRFYIETIFSVDFVIKYIFIYIYLYIKYIFCEPLEHLKNIRNVSHVD